MKPNSESPFHCVVCSPIVLQLTTGALYGNDKRFIIRGIQRTRMSAIAIFVGETVYFFFVCCVCCRAIVYMRLCLTMRICLYGVRLFFCVGSVVKLLVAARLLDTELQLY